MGNFLSFIYLSLLLLTHEIGHFLMAGLFGCSLYQICFYPFGGVSKFQMDLSSPLKEEFWILIMGPLFQIGCYFFLSHLPFSTEHLFLLKNIHFSLLCFNLLPIYPLDGGRLFLLFLENFLSFYRSFQVVFYSSFFLHFLFLLGFLWTKELNFLFLFLLLSYTLWKEKRNFSFYFDKFLLERYFGKYHYQKGKIVKTEKDFYRNRSHLIEKDGKYYLEQEFLQKKFMKSS